MPRILGVDIPKNKKIKISLRYLYGVGPVNALEILEARMKTLKWMILIMDQPLM